MCISKDRLVSVTLSTPQFHTTKDVVFTRCHLAERRWIRSVKILSFFCIFFSLNKVDVELRSTEASALLYFDISGCVFYSS